MGILNDGTTKFYWKKRSRSFEDWQKETEKIDSLVKNYYKGKITLAVFKEEIRKILI